MHSSEVLRMHHLSNTPINLTPSHALMNIRKSHHSVNRHFSLFFYFTKKNIFGMPVHVFTPIVIAQ